jgi:cell division septation protein DedD
MHEVFDEDDFKPGQHRRDTELTLGPMLLLGLFFGLLLLCGLCFGLGYTIGSHNIRGAAAASQPSASEALLPSAGALAKPSATSQQAVSQPQSVAVNQSEPEETDATDGQQSGAESVPGVNAAQPPAPAPASGLVVQVAVVARQEDADVLVGALRRRGFAAGVRRDAADGQFHVRIGPFSNRNDAYSTRQKLLGDGYNAVVQP